MSSDGLNSLPALESGELMSCAWCQGLFLPEDMDGEHCRECVEAIFDD